ncbi:MAG TPA: hypothetical protein ENJ53_01380 [Phaeodactylibacter sp.]|nr:hypothetical protein [Phaeodactylibacter sp.]
MKFKLILLFVFVSFWGQAQETYSYIHERVFEDPFDLVGYNFRPFKMEIPGDYDPTMIEAGAYSFGITRSRLYVHGDEKIRGLYEINNIAPTNYGYKLTLLDPNNPSNRGHLKVITNKYQEVEAIVFKKASKSNEIIFHLSDAPKSLMKKEKKYFTDLGEIAVEETDSLWGTKIYPYLRVNTNSNIQDRLYFADSTSISFEEVITIKEKKKKKKKRRRRKKKKKSKGIEENQSVEETEAVEEIEEANEVEEVNENVNIENIEDATTEEKIEDPAAAPTPEEEDEIVKRKITKTYFVKIKSLVKYKDGTSEIKTQSFPVKKIEEREDVSAKKNEERFQLEIKTKGKKKLYLYLNGDRTVSSFEINGVLYLVRGH